MGRKRILKEIQEDIRTLTRVPSEFIHAKLDELADEVGELESPGWIPITERTPEDESYILVSFENYTGLSIARYEEDDEGGKFYPGDDDEGYSKYGIYVNAWMPLPEPYREVTDEENLESRK